MGDVIRFPSEKERKTQGYDTCGNCGCAWWKARVVLEHGQVTAWGSRDMVCDECGTAMYP